MPDLDAVFATVFTNVVISTSMPPQGCLLSAALLPPILSLEIMFYVNAVSTPLIEAIIEPVLSSMVQG
jgi:hypothetical protein